MKGKFDLEERTLEFAKNALNLVKTLRPNGANKILINQFIRAATSIGANYREANDADSKKDFLHRIRICRREAKECLYWLDLIIYVSPQLKIKVAELSKEAEELVLIFSKIISTTSKNLR